MVTKYEYDSRLDTDEERIDELVNKLLKYQICNTQ